jgi:hypothetical protein
MSLTSNNSTRDKSNTRKTSRDIELKKLRDLSLQRRVNFSLSHISKFLIEMPTLPGIE